MEGDGENAHWFLEELEHFAATLAGAWCMQQAVPAIYRSQSLPMERLTTAAEWDPVALHEQLKHVERAVWQIPPAPNQMLGLDYCTSWSGPLDCYLDLLMQQQIVAVLTTNQPRYHAADLERVLQETAWSRDAAWQSERRARRYWLLKALEERVGDEVDGTVVERMGAACLVLLDAYPLKVFVPPQREAWATPGDRIRLSVAQVSARRDLIRVERPLRVH